jgi:Dyp-type peroxidase, N-terminal
MGELAVRQGDQSPPVSDHRVAGGHPRLSPTGTTLAVAADKVFPHRRADRRAGDSLAAFEGVQHRPAAVGRRQGLTDDRTISRPRRSDGPSRCARAGRLRAPHDGERGCLSKGEAMTRQAQAQDVLAPPARAAIFLVVTVRPGSEDAVRTLLGDVAGLTRAVGFRAPEDALSCVVGIGAELWDRLYASPRPAGLHPFRECVGAVHTAVSTPGDLLFHLRGRRMPCRSRSRSG